MNSIWDCKLIMVKKDPRGSFKNPYIHGEITCLVILDENKKWVDLRTNEKVVTKNINKVYGKTFSIDDIYIIIPETYLGRSLAKS